MKKLRKKQKKTMLKLYRKKLNRLPNFLKNFKEAKIQKEKKIY